MDFHTIGLQEQESKFGGSPIVPATMSARSDSDAAHNAFRQNAQVALFVGIAAWDTIALVPTYPQPDSRVVADSVVEAGGGPAATAAVACARLGVPSAFIGAVGDDARGERILGALAAEGVDVGDVVVCPGVSSSAAVIVVDRTHGTRALCPTLPPPLVFGARQAAAMAGAAIIHVDQAGYGPVTSLLDDRRIEVPLSVDAGNPIPGLAPSRVALFAPTLLQLQNMFGSGTPQSLLRRAGAPHWVVATDGGAGAYALRDETFWHVPAYVAEPCLSTLGAGDVFHGALVAAWVRGFEVAEAVAYAAIAAGLSCRGIDGRSAIPDHETVIHTLGAHRAVSLDPTEV
jgi:sulfofructose kinase